MWTVMETNEKTSRSTNLFGKEPGFCSQAAISVAARHVKLPSMHCMTTICQRARSAISVAAIAPSFGDIFAQNAVKNGLLTAVVSETEVAEMAATVSANPEEPISVNLEKKTIVCGNRTYIFEIDPVSRNQLLNGWDDIDLTDSYKARVAKFAAEHRARRPWIIPGKP